VTQAHENPFARGTRSDKTTKGERTRQTILQATLRLLATQGRQGVSHRAVAKEAGVSLSLTTYYFKDLAEMQIEALRLHKFELYEALRPYLIEYDATVEQMERDQAAGDWEAVGRGVRHLADRICAFVLNQVAERNEGLAIEMAFFFDLHMPEYFRQVAFELRQKFVEEIAALCAALGSPDPQADAELITGTIQRLQYEALSVPEHTNAERIKAQMQRLLCSLWPIPTSSVAEDSHGDHSVKTYS
jgi:DNA-binding transcriptional regulator YbjK